MHHSNLSALLTNIQNKELTKWLQYRYPPLVLWLMRSPCVIYQHLVSHLHLDQKQSKLSQKRQMNYMSLLDVVSRNAVARKPLVSPSLSSACLSIQYGFLTILFLTYEIIHRLGLLSK